MPKQSGFNNWLPVIKPPNMQYGYYIWNVWDIISNNMKLMLIDAEINTALNLQEKKQFLLQGLNSITDISFLHGNKTSVNRFSQPRYN